MLAIERTTDCLFSQRITLSCGGKSQSQYEFSAPPNITRFGNASTTRLYTGKFHHCRSIHPSGSAAAAPSKRELLHQAPALLNRNTTCPIPLARHNDRLWNLMDGPRFSSFALPCTPASPHTLRVLNFYQLPKLPTTMGGDGAFNLQGRGMARRRRVCIDVSGDCRR